MTHHATVYHTLFYFQGKIIKSKNKKLPGIGFEGSYDDILQNVFSKCFKNDEKHTASKGLCQAQPYA